MRPQFLWLACLAAADALVISFPPIVIGSITIGFYPTTKSTSTITSGQTSSKITATTTKSTTASSTVPPSLGSSVKPASSSAVISTKTSSTASGSILKSTAVSTSLIVKPSSASVPTSLVASSFKSASFGTSPSSTKTSASVSASPPASSSKPSSSGASVKAASSSAPVSVKPSSVASGTATGSKSVISSTTLISQVSSVLSPSSAAVPSSKPASSVGSSSKPASSAASSSKPASSAVSSSKPASSAASSSKPASSVGSASQPTSSIGSASKSASSKGPSSRQAFSSGSSSIVSSRASVCSSRSRSVAISASSIARISSTVLSGAISQSKPIASTASSLKPSSSGAPSSGRSTLPQSGTLGGSDCTITSFVTVTSTSIPIATLTTYVNVADIIVGDDFVPVPPAPPFVTITNDYTTSFDTTLTITATSVPSQYVGYTTTVTQYPPAGFVPVQDSLPGAGYDGKSSGSQKKRALRKRQDVASVCATAVVTITSISTANTRVSFVTDTSAVTKVVYPLESYTLYEPPTTSPFTVTKVQGTPVSVYPATTTSTYTVTQATATSTIYAACTANNYADYILQADGTKNPINFILLANGQFDSNFEIASSSLNINTAYDCCAWAIARNTSVWLLFDTNFCVASYPENSAPGTCLGQSDPAEQFQAAYANVTQRVLGNGYCGQVSSSVFSTDRGK